MCAMATADPFPEVDSGDDEDTHTGNTFVSMEDYIVTPSLRNSQNLTNNSQHSSMAILDSDVIDDRELMNNVAESAADLTLQDTSAFVWDLPNDDQILNDENSSEFQTPAPNMASTNQTHEESNHFAHSYHETEELLYSASSTNLSAEMKSTPRVIRNQFDAINNAETTMQSETDMEPTVSVSEAVTSTTIPNFFKIAAPYSNIASPDADEGSLIVFSRTGPVGKQEIEALSKLATSKPTPLSRVVEMLVYTVEFQTHELTNMKHSEIDMASKNSDEEHRRFAEVDRRRSICIKRLLEELDEKAAEIARLNKVNQDYSEKLESEKQFNFKFRSQCENLDSSIKFNSGVENAFSALKTFLHSSRRKSEATMNKQRLELEEYAERLLELEKKLSDSQRRQTALLDENTSLKVELAAHVHHKDCGASVETPSVHCTNNSSTHIDHSVLVQEISTLSEEAEVLRKEHRAAMREKDEIENRIFKSDAELKNSKSKIKELEAQLSEADANKKFLKESRDNLEEHSRKVAKELSQNAVNAVKELEKKEMDIKQLRYELEDREQAMNSYREQIQQLENQVNSAMRETINRGISITSGSSLHSSSSKINHGTDKALFTLQEEVESARELLNIRREELESVTREMKRVRNELKLTEEEMQFWKSQATTQARDSERMEKKEYSEVQHDTFLRRLSIKLNCHANNKRDLIKALVERIEELIKERVELEAMRGKLNAQIVEREEKLHAIRSEYETEIATLKCSITQAENSRDRAIDDRAAAEKKFDELVKLEDDTELDVTLDTTASFGFTFTEGSRNLKLDEDVMHWNDQTIDAAVQAVNHLIGSKNDLSSRNQTLREKLNNLLSGGFNAEDTTIVSREVLMESRELQEELLRIIGSQQQAIRRYKGRRVDFTDGQEDVSVTLTQDGTVTMTNTHDFSGNFTEEGSEFRSFGQTSPVVTRRLSKATSFLRQQLEEVRTQYTEKMNDNTKLSTVVKDMEHKLESTVHEKRGSEGRFMALTKLHETFVRTLGEMLNVRSSTVVIESCVRDLLKTVSNLKIQNEEHAFTVNRFNTRLHKFAAQKRVYEHMMGIYQRKYYLNILALPPRAERKKSRLRSVVFAVMACERIAYFLRTRGHTHKQSEFIDISSSYNLPSSWRIADTRTRSIPFTSALIAIQSNSKLQAALIGREQEIEELRQILTTLKTVSPSTEYVEFNANSSFDYSQELMDRKNDIAHRLQKAIQEKEALDALLSHERQHRATAEARANKYLEKASKLHTKLQTVKLTADNRERTYKAAIRYLKQKADSAIEEEVENMEPNQPGTEPATGGSSAGDVKVRWNNIAVTMSKQMRSAQEKLETMESGTTEHKDQQLYIKGLRSTVKRLKKASGSRTSVLAEGRQSAPSSSESRVDTPAS